ncbi:MAG: tRNA epoxyqueuosine(34) reductase QueG [Pseudomonadota bacterium]
MTNSTFDIAALRRKSTALGFASLGITPARTSKDTQAALQRFLAKQRHGDMAWMAETAPRRASPEQMWPDARTAVMLSANYAPPHNPLEDLGLTSRGNISVYARNKDYHDVLKKRLKTLASWIAQHSGAQVKVFVDTAPLMEKPLAAQAGLGWQGKHTNLVSRAYGSWQFLGAILTDMALEPTEPEGDSCGSCQACLDICPTKAFPAPYQLDARRCISYLTIEFKGHIPAEFRRAMGNRIYGCDDCLAVCPWNKFAQDSSEIAFYARPELTAPLLTDLLGLDDASFRDVFSASPVKRIGRDRFIRNCLIAAGNSQDLKLIRAIKPLLGDAVPIVRAMAVWALKELLDDTTFLAATSALRETETDPDVLAELIPGTLDDAWVAVETVPTA